MFGMHSKQSRRSRSIRAGARAGFVCGLTESDAGIACRHGLQNQGVSHAADLGHNVFDFFDFFDFYGGLVGPEGLEPPTKAL